MGKYIKIKVIPRAKRNKIIKDSEVFKVYLTSPPVDDKANKQLVKILSEYLDVPKRCIKIVKGQKSREKIIEVIKNE